MVILFTSAQGIISSSIGNLTGSTGMQTSGEETKQAGISELKEYQAQNPPPADGTGSGIEAKIGSAVGCEGLVNSATGDTSQPTSTSSSGIIASDADAKGSLGNLGGTDQPGKPVSSNQSIEQEMVIRIFANFCAYRLF